MNWYLIFVFIIQYVVSGGQRVTEDRIVNGANATQNQFPWMAAIYRNAFNKYTKKPQPRTHQQHCGGTIISETIILTAAHCIFENDYSNRPPTTIYQYGSDDLGVVVGTSNLWGINSDSSNLLAVERFLVNKDYNTVTLQNDIALIKLRQKLEFINGQIQPIALESHVVNIDKMATVAGWGDSCKQHPNLISELHLKYANVQILPVGICYEVRVTDYLIPDTILCAGPGLRVYKGDSGGGLWVTENNRLSLIGIVSITENCNTRNPAIFVNVPYFYQWIVNNANNLMGLGWNN